MSARMSGHVLYKEGAPVDPKGNPVNIFWGGTYGPGCAMCSCGAISPGLSSVTKRKAWHRAHKEDLRKESRK